MPSKNKKKKNRTQRGGSAETSVVPRISFRSVMNPRRDAVFTKRLSLTTTMATATYGSWDTTSASLTTEWSAIVGNLFGSVRIVAMRVYTADGTSSPGTGFFLFCTYRNGASPSSSIAAMWASENPKLFDSGSTTKTLVSYEARPTGVGDGAFLAYNSLPNSFGVKLYNGNAATINVFVEYIAQFRGQL